MSKKNAAATLAAEPIARRRPMSSSDVDLLRAIAESFDIVERQAAELAADEKIAPWAWNPLLRALRANDENLGADFTRFVPLFRRVQMNRAAKTMHAMSKADYKRWVAEWNVQTAARNERNAERAAARKAARVAAAKAAAKLAA
jgi:hypothetical protein